MQKNSSPEVLYHNDGMSHTIDIVRSEDKNIIMMVNGNIEADTTFVQKRHFVLKAHLPLLLRGDSNEVAVVGLGLGITLKSLLKNPLSKKVELIELSPDMIKAHRMNPEISDNVLENSKLKIVIDDARNYMNMSKKKFDIITADPIHPRITGVGYLYTKEYYEILEDRLKKNGIVLQWMPMYRISKDSFDVALRTFVEVYPNSTFWYVRGHGLLVGSKQEKKINFSDLVSRFNSEEIKNDLKSIGINSPHELLGHMIMDKDKISQYLMSKEKRLINTDDNAYLEFHTPFEFLEKTKDIIVELKPFVGWNIDSLLESYTEKDKVEIQNAFNNRSIKLISELEEKIQ